MTPPWLDALVAALGPAEIMIRDRMGRWTWSEGDQGVRIDQHGDGDATVWQLVAWTPERSVTMRNVSAPDDETCSRALALAGLIGHDAHELVTR